MFGDFFLNSVFRAYESYQKTITFENCTIDSDGTIFDFSYYVTLRINRVTFNMTNLLGGGWNEMFMNCYSLNQSDAISDTIIENSLFIERY